MGLDQYLVARRYVGAWKHSTPEERETYARIMTLAAPRATDFVCEGSPHLTVEVNVAYWRKANQVHAWFVAHVQEGNDDCGKYYVSQEKLIELRDLCKQVIDKTPMKPGRVYQGSQSTDGGPLVPQYSDGQVVADATVAEELLPNKGGFFFGSTNYDEYYMDDLKRTVEMIDEALRLFGGSAADWDFQYSSSW